MNDTAQKLTAFDPAERLTSDEAMASFMAEAFETTLAGMMALGIGLTAKVQSVR